MSPETLLIALNAADRITRAALCRLGASLERWAEAPSRDARRLAAELGVPHAQLRRAFAVRRRAVALARRELEGAEHLGCRILTLADGDYPQALRDHPLPPPALYCRGRVPRGPAVAIVGSRRSNAYGREVAELFARELAAAGVTVVSGFARGVDSAAHRAALDVPGGRTVAVLGCGIDVDYPRGNAPLASAIESRGAVLSEFPPGSPPRPWHFPVRNRVIAALALGTLVAQAKLRSGSLITAHLALDLGRDVYAVPGGIFDEHALGTNALIADGALLARTPADVLESLSLGHQQQLFPVSTEPVATPVRKAPPGFPGRLLELLRPSTPRTAEELAGALDVPVDRVLGALLELELQGYLHREPGPVYVRAV